MPQLENSDVMYRLLIQSVVDYAIYMLTPDGVVANWNAGAQRAKGYTADEIVGQHYSVFYTPADRASGIPRLNLEIARRDFEMRPVARPFTQPTRFEVKVVGRRSVPQPEAPAALLTTGGRCPVAH